MKQDKALLKLGGRSLLQRQFEMLERLLGKDNVIISGDRPEFPHVTDIDSSLGPLEGLRSVCKYLLKEGRQNPLLVVPVDMPFMTNGGISRLIHCASDKTITKYVGQQLPIVINNPADVLSVIEEMKKRPQGEYESSLKNLFKKVDVQEIDAEPESFFANINTPEEWNAALS